MGENSKIEWCHHTWNPWRGCTKVSSGCAHCYAEKLSHRNPRSLGIWGDNGSRAVGSESYWREPFKWNQQAQSERVRRRVFCGSLMDAAEDRPELEPLRERMKETVEAAHWLDWLLLSKRPENYSRMFWDVWPENAWAGTSAEDDETFRRRTSYLMRVKAVVRFVSCEPMIGRIDIPAGVLRSGDMVIVGGESGRGARAMNPEWVRWMRDTCSAWGIPFFFKQWGEWAWAPDDLNYGDATKYLKDRFGKHVEIEFHSDGRTSARVGKERAGRLLDGREWNQFPDPKRRGCA